MAQSACADDLTAGDPIEAYVLEDHIGFLLRRAHQRHASIFNDLAGATELTPTQFAALIKTVQLGRVTQNHLGRLTAMDPATIQGVVRRLTERGYIVRAIDPMDRRSAVLAPTGAAIAAAAEALPAVRAVAERMLEPLDAKERAQLAALLARLG